MDGASRRLIATALILVLVWFRVLRRTQLGSTEPKHAVQRLDDSHQTDQGRPGRQRRFHRRTIVASFVAIAALCAVGSWTFWPRSLSLPTPNSLHVRLYTAVQIESVHLAIERQNDASRWRLRLIVNTTDLASVEAVKAVEAEAVAGADFIGITPEPCEQVPGGVCQGTTWGPHPLAHGIAEVAKASWRPVKCPRCTPPELEVHRGFHVRDEQSFRNDRCREQRRSDQDRASGGLCGRASAGPYAHGRCQCSIRAAEDLVRAPAVGVRRRRLCDVGVRSRHKHGTSPAPYGAGAQPGHN